MPNVLLHCPACRATIGDINTPMRHGKAGGESTKRFIICPACNCAVDATLTAKPIPPDGYTLRIVSDGETYDDLPF